MSITCNGPISFEIIVLNNMTRVYIAFSQLTCRVQVFCEIFMQGWNELCKCGYG